jgi:DNA-binding LytR/AlgR family response regulator
MDIEMPHMDGMEAAYRLREVDPNVMLIFVTKLSQLAIKGYEVSAYDFIEKPVDYSVFSIKLKRALAGLNARKEIPVVLHTSKGLVRLFTSEIMYVECIGHQIIYHTETRDYVSYGSLKKLESEPWAVNFVRCNHCYLLNLSFIYKVEGYTAYVKDIPIAVSHPKRQEFLEKLNRYLGVIL